MKHWCRCFKSAEEAAAPEPAAFPTGHAPAGRVGENRRALRVPRKLSTGGSSSLPCSSPITPYGNAAVSARCGRLESVTDVQGINRISEQVLSNAAHALAGMIAHARKPSPETKPAIGLTMFGVTTPCVQAVSHALEEKYDCLVFHATGTGGQSMEKLVDSGLLSGVIDVTTTEVCDLLMGGVFSAGEDRFGSIIRSRIPYVGSGGALDMVNFGPLETVPERYKDRNLHRHNPQVTLMRTTAEENARMGVWIGERLNRMEGPVRFLIPEGGVSLLDQLGGAFWDPAADAALFRRVQATVRQGRAGAWCACPTMSTTRPSPRRWPRISSKVSKKREGEMARIARKKLIEKFRAMVARGEPIIGGGAGTGLSAKCEEAGGIDLIVIYNSGRYRMAGRGSLAGLLAYGNANEIVLEMAREVLPVVQHTPVLAGVNGTDPFMLREPFLKKLADLGFSGVQNFPTVGPDRRRLPRQSRRDRHGLRPRGRDDPQGPMSSTS